MAAAGQDREAISQLQNLHFDERLEPTNFKQLGSIQSREARNIIPNQGKGPYGPGGDIAINNIISSMISPYKITSINI